MGHFVITLKLFIKDEYQIFIISDFALELSNISQPSFNKSDPVTHLIFPSVYSIVILKRHFFNGLADRNFPENVERLLMTAVPFGHKVMIVVLANNFGEN